MKQCACARFKGGAWNPPPLDSEPHSHLCQLRIELHAEYDYSWLCISLNLHRDMWGPQAKPNWRDIYHHCHHHHHHRHHHLYVTSRDTAPGWWWWWWWWWISSHGWRWRADPWTSNVLNLAPTVIAPPATPLSTMSATSLLACDCSLDILSLNLLILSLLSVCLSVLDAYPPKLLNRFGWNFAQRWRSVSDTVCIIMVAIAPRVSLGQPKIHRVRDISRQSYADGLVRVSSIFLVWHKFSRSKLSHARIIFNGGLYLFYLKLPLCVMAYFIFLSKNHIFAVPVF